MTQFPTLLPALIALLVFDAAGWLVSLFQRNVNIVDGMWPLMFLIAALCYAATLDSQSSRSRWCCPCARCSGRCAFRPHIPAQLGRARRSSLPAYPRAQSPNFAFKSLLHRLRPAGAACVDISMPLLPAISSAQPLGAARCVAGIALCARPLLRNRWRLAARAVPRSTGQQGQGDWTPDCGGTHGTPTTSASSASGGATA